MDDYITFCPFVKFAWDRFNIFQILFNFFKNNHFANAKYREAIGYKLVMPQGVH